MINGAHAVIYSTDAVADRTFLKDVLGFPHVDVGDGWLIFALPPSEVAVHPAENNDRHELFLMCDDIQKFSQAMKENNVSCSEVQELRWGLLVRISLPGGGSLGVYQPLHERAPH